MNYTINETFEMSGYRAVIEADQNLASLITDKFHMEVRDILTNQVEEITKEDLMKWGISVDTNLDPSLWEIQSCINNGGMYINFNGNTLTFKQIIPCLSGDIPMGYNSSVYLIELESILYLNYIMHCLDEKENDLIMVGSQSGTVEYDYGNVALYNFPQKTFLLGTLPDIIVLCVNSYDDENYIS